VGFEPPHRGCIPPGRPAEAAQNTQLGAHPGRALAQSGGLHCKT
jgi:hypothetical protein